MWKIRINHRKSAKFWMVLDDVGWCWMMLDHCPIIVGSFSGWWYTYPSEKWWSESQLGWWRSVPNCFWKVIQNSHGSSRHQFWMILAYTTIPHLSRPQLLSWSKNSMFVTWWGESRSSSPGRAPGAGPQRGSMGWVAPTSTAVFLWLWWNQDMNKVSRHATIWCLMSYGKISKIIS